MNKKEIIRPNPFEVIYSCMIVFIFRELVVYIADLYSELPFILCAFVIIGMNGLEVPGHMDTIWRLLYTSINRKANHKEDGSDE